MTTLTNTSTACLIGAVVALARVTDANDNGKALTPPMGWRSWNFYGKHVDQSVMIKAMDAMVSKKRNDASGTPTSLCDLGYCDVGLDGGWNDCGSDEAARYHNTETGESVSMHYHDIRGRPIVNLTAFPDMKQMTDHAHSLGLTAGWYGNNCNCHDECKSVTWVDDVCGLQIQADVDAFIQYGFDSWKLDSCGDEMDLHLFNEFLIAANTTAVMENCHQGHHYPAFPDRSLPPAEGCPWNMWRTSYDIIGAYGSVMYNLDSLHQFQVQNLSYPGCWAYLDSLWVGIEEGAHGSLDIGLTPAETRSHFGSWVIASSPLILGLDLTNDTAVDAVWPLISNREAIAINQDYVGDSGGVFARSDENVTVINPRIHKAFQVPINVSAWQTFAKSLSGGRVAVLFLNSQNHTDQTFSIDFSQLPALTACGHDSNTKKVCSVRDVWLQKDVAGGPFHGTFQTTVAPHDAALYVLAAA